MPVRRLALAAPLLAVAALAAPGGAQAAAPTAAHAPAAAQDGPTASAAHKRCRTGFHVVRRNGRRVCRRNVRRVVPQPAPVQVAAPAPAPAPAPTIVDTARAQTDAWARYWLGRGTAVDFFMLDCVQVSSFSAFCRVGLVLPGGAQWEQYRINVYTGQAGVQLQAAFEGRFLR